GSRKMGDAAGDLPAGEGLDDGERAPFGGERLEHDAFERLVVLAKDEVAETPPHFFLHRRQLRLDFVHIGAAYGELRLDLRIVGAEAELDAAVRHQLLDPGEQLVDMRLAEPI